MIDEKLYPPRPEADWASCLPKFYPRKLSENSIKIARYLIDLAKEGAPPTTYLKTGGKIGLRQNSRVLFTHLGVLSWVAYRNENVFLSVLVTRQKEKTPGDDFFEMVAGFREEPYQADNDSFTRECNLVYEAAKEEKLDFILTGETLKD